MERKIALGISTLFHPLLVPTLFVFVLLRIDPHFFFSYGAPQKLAIVQVVAFGTILPGLIYLIVSRLFSKKNIFGKWSLLERTIGLFVVGLLNLEFWYLIKTWGMNPAIGQFFLASSVVLICLAIISSRYKISIHAASWAGALTALFISFSNHHYFSFPVIAGFTLILGLVGSSRMILGEHTLGQIVSGTVLAAGVFAGLNLL
jgi:hypothetical protein